MIFAEEMMDLARLLHETPMPRPQRARIALAIGVWIAVRVPDFNYVRFIITAVEGPGIRRTPGG